MNHRNTATLRAVPLLWAAFGAIMSASAEAILSGTVSATDGRPLAGVVVSDGKQVVRTDSTGTYSLLSDKSKGTVWVSLPRGYEAPCDGFRPLFYATLSTNPDAAERHDFTLRPVANPDNYAILVTTDQHLTGRPTADTLQWRTLIVPDFNATVERLRSQGRSVYCVALGDASWDRYWGPTSFGIPDVVSEFNALDCPIFSAIGNHDYNPYVSGDTGSTAIFREMLCPTYYSFNLGKVHYVVLDNIVAENNGASSDAIGDRKYYTLLDQDQLDWLAKDLATLADTDAPVVVCAHVPFYTTPKLAADGTATTTHQLGNTAAIEQVLAPYSNVKAWVGHHHRHFNVASPTHAGITQWCYPATCGTFWYTGAPASEGGTGTHLATDGCVGGYGVWEVDGTDMSYRYKSPGLPDDYQMRIYDLNTVVIPLTALPKSARKKALEYVHGYNEPAADNELLVNVFAYGPGWTVTATERIGDDERPLSVERIVAYDPLHVLAYNMPQLRKGRRPGGSATKPTAHFFKMRASAPDTPVTITVTDPWGHVYSETAERPKPFSLMMK